MAEKKPAKKIQIRIETMAAFLLLIVLAVFTIMLISSTGSCYRNIVSAGNSAQETRTALLFVSTKVRQADSGSSVGVAAAPWGGNAIVISQETAGMTYEDWIFFYDGALREILIPKGTDIIPSACDKISNLSAFSMALSGNTLAISAQADNPASTVQSLTLMLRT